MIDPIADETFWSNVIMPSNCMEWTGARAIGGYGKYRNLFAHRVAWELVNGPIPKGGWILHHCDNPICVRPSHLYLGTPKDNARDRELRGRGRKRLGLTSTHCRAGHERNDANVYTTPSGERHCRPCTARRGRAYQARQREKRQAAA